MFKTLVVACACSLALASAQAAVDNKRAAANAAAANAAKAKHGFVPSALAAPPAPEAAAPQLPPPPAMSAAQVVERNAAARGGLKAWRAVSALTMEGTLDAGGKPAVDLPYVMRVKRGHKSRLEIRFKDQTAVQVFDGKQGWKLRPFLNRHEVEPFTAAEAKTAGAWDELDGPLIDHAAKGVKVESAGSETVEGRNTYRLLLTDARGGKRQVWVDAETFLETRIEGTPRRLDGKVRKTFVYLRDFKTEAGLTTPRVMETVVEGVKPTHKLTVARLAVNEPMADTLFAKPDLKMALAGPAATPAR